VAYLHEKNIIHGGENHEKHVSTWCLFRKHASTRVG
jgi:hypothetical protein